MKNSPNILVLGATGMVGHTVYSYLHKKYPKTVWGTSRKRQASLYCLDATSVKKDLQYIIKRTRSLDYVINCIGVVRPPYKIADIVFSNSLFPHILDELAEKYNFKLIHISTDAVFSDTAGICKEDNKLSANDIYAASKLIGETDSPNSISVRTSFLGLDPKNKGGLVEFVRGYQGEKIPGFINQTWSGCTTLQFAQYCFDIIRNNYYDTLRKKSSVFHFAPLCVSSKYLLIKVLIKKIKSKKSVIKTKSFNKSRILGTNYFDIQNMSSYTTNINQALHELIEYELKI